MGKRQYRRLTALDVDRARAPGRYADGDGLFLLVDKDGAKRWVLRYSAKGRRRDLGLGSARIVTLAGARQKALDARRLLLDGADPIDARARTRLTPLFADYARALHSKIKGQWRNPKHAAQWLTTLEAYAFPVIGTMRLSEIEAPDVRRALEPIWLEKPETARRVRQRIGQVLDSAAADGHRSGDNPAKAAMAGHARPVRETERHAAMPYPEVPGFITALRGRDMFPLAALAFEFLILTAARTSEALGARWDEIDWEAKLWRIPGSRMKGKRLHEVPLAARPLAILKEARKHSGNGELIFPARSPDRPFSNMVFLQALKRMNVPYTSHGFRSSFRDWAAERTSYPRQLCEYALAHALADDVEAAYQRSTLLEQRRRLMADWAKFCGGAK